MDRSEILSSLREELDRVEKALRVLKGLGHGKSASKTARNGRRRGRRRLNAAARRKISEGMKKRWAQRKRNK
jgi:hypothetical protein